MNSHGGSGARPERGGSVSRKSASSRSVSKKGVPRGKVRKQAVKRAAPGRGGAAGAMEGLSNPLQRADAMAGAAAAFSEEGDHAKAAQLFSEAIRLTAPLWFAKGLEALNASEPRMAAESLGMAAKLDPGNAHAWMFQGFALVRCGRANQGLRAIRRAIARDGECAQAWFYKACAHHALGQRKAFEDSLRKAFYLDPERTRAAVEHEEMLVRAMIDPLNRGLTRLILGSHAGGDDSTLAYIA